MQVLMILSAYMEKHKEMGFCHKGKHLKFIVVVVVLVFLFVFFGNLIFFKKYICQNAHKNGVYPF